MPYVFRCTRSQDLPWECLSGLEGVLGTPSRARHCVTSRGAKWPLLGWRASLHHSAVPPPPLAASCMPPGASLCSLPRGPLQPPRSPSECDSFYLRGGRGEGANAPPPARVGGEKMGEGGCTRRSTNLEKVDERLEPNGNGGLVEDEGADSAEGGPWVTPREHRTPPGQRPTDRPQPTGPGWRSSHLRGGAPPSRMSSHTYGVPRHTERGGRPQTTGHPP